MYVVNFMAGVAVLWGSGVDTIDMAGSAGDGSVCPGEREGSQRVIDGSLLPVGAVVA